MEERKVFDIDIQIKQIEDIDNPVVKEVSEKILEKISNFVSDVSEYCGKIKCFINDKNDFNETESYIYNISKDYKNLAFKIVFYGSNAFDVSVNYIQNGKSYTVSNKIEFGEEIAEQYFPGINDVFDTSKFIIKKSIFNQEEDCSETKEV